MATIQKQDYLKFDAATMKNALIRKLSENSKFTDQLFDDSNLSIIIETFSYMFEVMMYYANHGASEAMFTDSLLYENMNRIVKMLGYNPKGYGSSSLEVLLASKSEYNESNPMFESSNKVLPKYSYVDIGTTDSNGSPICFSTIQNTFIDNFIPTSNNDKVTMVNGKWKIYSQKFIAAGVPLEEFTLNNIDISENSTNRKYIAHPYIDTYINRNGTYYTMTAVSDGTIFGKNSVTGPKDLIFELRLNENQKYVMKFGDGIHGAKLEPNDEITVVYLESNGPSGKIGANIINESIPFKYIAELSEPNSELLQMMGLQADSILTNGTEDPNDNELSKLYAYNIYASSEPTEIESVEDIRANAPTYYRTGGRLVTAEDFKDFMLSNFRNDVYDVVVMNNWEYMAKFQYWLSKFGRLNQEIRSASYLYSDSCDFNNVYIWTRFKNKLDQAYIESVISPKKVLTCEPIILESIARKFYPCANPEATFANYVPNSDEHWIEIIKDESSYVTVDKLKKNVSQIIRDFFDSNNVKIGGNFNLNALYNSILNVNGVKSVKTAYLKSGDQPYQTVYYNGMKFASWTDDLISGDDFEIVNGMISLETFQHPELYDIAIESKIKVVVDTFGRVSMEY